MEGLHADGGDGEGLFACAATVDITPPLGIHLHNWAYSPHRRSTGVHRPLEAKLLGLADGPRRQLIVALDFGWFMESSDEAALRAAILAAGDLPEENLLLCLTHTHSGPSLSRADREEPGGELIAPYLDDVAAKVGRAAREMWQNAEPAGIDWRYGTCGLAVNRDLYRRDERRYVVGPNPGGETDDTLLVGWVTKADGSLLAAIVNYAVHPISLGGDNALISPDLVGSARHAVEQELSAPFIFMQGASGDLSPRVIYSGDTAAADANGLSLGHAVLSLYYAGPPPQQRLVYSRTIESGAPLGIAEAVPYSGSGELSSESRELVLPVQNNQPPQNPGVPEQVRRDRELRARRVRSNVDDGHTRFPVTIWRAGDALIIGYPGEAYSALQRQLRARFSPVPLAFVNLANGAHQGYIAPRNAYEDGRYPAWQSPLAEGAFEELVEALEALIEAHIGSTRVRDESLQSRTSD